MASWHGSACETSWQEVPLRVLRLEGGVSCHRIQGSRQREDPPSRRFRCAHNYYIYLSDYHVDRLTSEVNRVLHYIALDMIPES